VPRERRTFRRDTYWTLATRPLHILVFLAPLIAAYEIGAAAVLGPHAAGIETIRAHERLARALDVLGVAGAFLPWVVLVTILIVAHIMARDPLRIRPGVLLGMLGESAALTLPLLVLAALLFRLEPDALPPAMPQEAGAVALSDLPWTARAVLSIGAGLYEELVFRMILLAAVHMVLSDFVRIRSDISAGIAIAISAIAFALYHDLAADGTALAQSAFYVLAGVYFGAVYAVRGFGVVVGAHALYDFMVLVVL
jgi:membrane protease YdiL (CAAX protease family)